MILRYVRTNGRLRPAEAESVGLSADGLISGWRTVSTSAVGSFAGTLPGAETQALQDLIDAVAGAPPPDGPPPPDAATESVEIAGREPVSIAAVRGPDESAWGRLATAARDLLERLTDHPLAAVGLAPAAGHARLEHRGTERLELDLASVQLRVNAWRGYYEPAGEWSATVAGPGRVVAGPGWFHDFDLEPPFATAGPGVTVHLRADFAVIAGGLSLAVAVSHTPEPPGG
jgi:hypothetical protein